LGDPRCARGRTAQPDRLHPHTQLLVFSTIQPVIFVRMFRYAFGGAISVPGVGYVDFLIQGIFVQTVVFGSMARLVGFRSGGFDAGMAQVFAEPQPVSVTASAVRALAIGGPTTSYVFQCLAWCIGILVVFAPLPVARYRSKV
jgi:hypothetical protein